MPRYRQTMREALQEVAESDEVIDEAMKWEVKISGLPTFYSDGKSRGQVRQALRKMLKRPDDIQSIERTTPAALKKIRRDQAKGEGAPEDVKKEEVEDAFDYKAKKGAIAAPGSGSIAKAKKAKASDVTKSIEQQMKDALKEHIKDAIKEKATIDTDQVVNMIQFGHPFKVVDEDIPPELPGAEVPRYKNVSNAVVDKADKKSNKAMAKAEKDTLIPTQTKESIVDRVAKVIEDSDWAKSKRIDKQVSDRLLKIHQEREKRYQAQQAKQKQAREEVEIDEKLFGQSGLLGYGPGKSDWGKSKEAERKDSERLSKQQASREIRHQAAIAKDKKNQNKDPVGKQHEGTAAQAQYDASYKSRAATQKTRERERIITAKANAAKRGPHVAKAIEKEEVEVDEILKWKVDVKGNPPAYMDGKSAAAVRQRERRIVKRPKDIGSVTRVTPSEYRKTLRQAAAGKLDLTKVPEEVEIDELSKKTLGSYVKKAAPNLAVSYAAGATRVSAKRKKGINTAADKLAKEEVVIEQEGGVTDDSGYTRYPSTGNWAGIKGKTYKKNLVKAKVKQQAQAKKKVDEVAPPGWGHTKAEKEKTKPDKPKSKIGGSAHEFQKDLDSGKFKGLPGDKTYKDKKASMFKLMWSMKNKGDKPHYKPGVKDKLKSQYKKEENLLDSAKRYLNEKADWSTAFKSAAQSRPPMKYKDAVSFIDTAGLNSTEKRSALKAAKKWLR